MSYLGSWKIDDLLTFTIVTHTVTTGAATDADSAPAYRVYEDETSTPILTGTMALLDSANTAGFYSEQITLSAANGFEKGKSYNIYISATVNSVAGATVRNLQIEAEVDANVVSGTVATVTNVTTVNGLAANVITAASIATGAIDADAIADNAIDAGAIAADAITAAKIADGAIDAATFAASAITSTVLANDAITAAKLHADVTTELQSGLATAANLSTVAGYLDTEIAAILADTNELQTDWVDGGRLDLILDARSNQTSVDDLPTNAELSTALGTADDAVLAQVALVKAKTDLIPAAPASTTNITAGTITTVTNLTNAPTAGDFTATMKASINTEADTALADYDAPTSAELVSEINAVQTDIAALNDLTAAEVNAEVVDVIRTDVIPDSVPADGSRPTVAQAALMILRFLTEKSVSGTTVTVKKEDGSTSSMTFTLDSATDPTSITRAT